MNKREPVYSWCTGVPRPTLIANLDAGEVIIFYYTAPICASVCKTAVMKLTGASAVESLSINDDENRYLHSGLMRDTIYVKKKGKQKEYIFLFHNEIIKVVADSLEELPGEDSVFANLKQQQTSSFERE
ncbi:MAG: hypothetical protein PHI97_33850 [Desulfobulbus sp.]|nr:hypothetical protein [Desulfobulbus sp.]